MNRKKRIIAKAIFAVLTAVMLFACKPEGEKVTGVVLDHRELKADIGQTVTLTATVLPAEAANPKVSWEAVPKGIVELTADGALCAVKAVKAGKAAVLVTTEDGGFTTICTVTVLPVPAESVTLDRETVSLVLGNPAADTATLTATVFPENATDKTVIWSAEPADAVKLTDYKDGRCTVKALKVGETVVTATAADGGFTTTCTVTVSLIAAESIELDRNELNLIVGDPAADTAMLTATVFPENAADKTVRWSVDKTGYIELTDNGDGSCTVKALKVGETVVTATTADGGFTATCTVTVVPVAAESVELNRDELNLIWGDPAADTATLTATVFPENALNKTVSWNAVPKGVVELTVDGAVCTVKALKEGEVVVMAIADDGGFTTICTVTVLPVLPESIELDRDELNLIMGDPESKKATLTATVFPENTTDKRVRWTVSPEDVVSLRENEDGSCTVTAVGTGVATAIVASVDNPTLTAACRISVDYLYLTNTALIKAIDDRATDSKGTRISVGWTKESDGTVKLTPENRQKIRAVTELSIHHAYLSDLGGIEYFTGLTYLNCGGNWLTTLDVTKNTALTYLNCGSNQLTTLDVSKNTALTYLNCGGNWLTTLDVTKNTALTELYCYNTNLTTLDVSKNTALTKLSCHTTKLTTLDVTKNTALKELLCALSNLTTLDVSKNTALTELYCNNTNLTTLDVTKNTALTYLNCDSNQLTTLDVTKNTALTYLDCDSNQLTTLDVTKNTALTELYCGYNSLASLDIRSLSRLSDFWCFEQKSSDGSFLQLTLKLTRDQQSKFRLENGGSLKLEVYN